MKLSNATILILGLLFVSHLLAKEKESILMYHVEFYIMLGTYFIVRQLELNRKHNG